MQSLYYDYYHTKNDNQLINCAVYTFLSLFVSFWVDNIFALSVAVAARIAMECQVTVLFATN